MSYFVFDVFGGLFIVKVFEWARQAFVYVLSIIRVRTHDLAFFGGCVWMRDAFVYFECDRDGQYARACADCVVSTYTIEVRGSKQKHYKPSE